MKLSDLDRQTKHLKKLARKSAISADPKTVHGLRVLTRRLRAPLWLGEKCCDEKSIKKSNERLKRLGRALGEKRKWDVAIEDAKVFGVRVKPLKTLQKNACKELQESLRPKDVKKLLSDLSAAKKRLKKIPAKKLRRPLPELEQNLRHALKHPPKNKKGRHKLRIEIKKVRYLLETFGLTSEMLKRLQDSLGREHDLSTLLKATGPNPAIHRDELRAKEEAERLMAQALAEAIQLLQTISGARENETHSDPPPQSET